MKNLGIVTKREETFNMSNVSRSKGSILDLIENSPKKPGT
ncbi:24137_t:CDS:2 [Gigaspora margarita]|uniref:24137_t:CDS:1 n=1 Tax=Gigaspora margarita TaxID=4874 RepID=A0ABN7VZ54_GIGMA|nr:24137_t:CDS:2 [Gigaspora margarita]